MKDIQLYDYQREMSERIEAAFRSCQSVMVQMPTGTGKTILLAEVVKREKGKVKNPCVKHMKNTYIMIIHFLAFSFYLIIV